MDDLLLKYQKELKKELGNEWSMYALDEEKVNIVIEDSYTFSYIMSIDLKNVTYSYTPEFASQSAKTRAILTKLVGEFMFGL